MGPAVGGLVDAGEVFCQLTAQVHRHGNRTLVVFLSYQRQSQQGGGGLIRSIHNLASCVFLSNSVKPELITTVKQAVVGTESEKTSRPTVFSQLRRNDRDVTIFKANSHQGCKKKLQLKCN